MHCKQKMSWKKVCYIVRNRFPILAWAPRYNLHTAIADLVAGFTIGLTLIPQCIAYASLAGLGPEYGLYSSLFGGFIYAVFGKTPELNVAPTALISLLTFSFTGGVSYGNTSAAVLLCFLCGVIELSCGVLQLGFLVDFVSTPVVAAFTSAGALTIASSQVKNLLGIKIEAITFTGVWYEVFKHIRETKRWDAALGVTCCVVLLLMRKLKDFGSPPLVDDKSEKAKDGSTLKTLIWFISVARNAFVVLACAVAAYFMGTCDLALFTLTSKVPGGLPTMRLPFAEVTTSENVTITALEMAEELGFGIFVLPFVSILGNVALAKAWSNGKVVDASQEMTALGMCNLFGSFFGSFPVNAAFSRSALSNASGVKTPLAGIYTGTMVILALTFLTPYFSYIPKPTLAAVIICAVVFMVEISLTRMIWYTNKKDLVPFVVTLISCLVLGIEIGIIVGVIVDLVFLLHTTARPKVLIEKITNDYNLVYIKITPTSALLFPSAEFVREKIMQINHEEENNYNTLVIDCQRINKMDFTGAKCMAAFIDDFNRMHKKVIIYRPKKSVEKILRSVITEEMANVVEDESDLFEEPEEDRKAEPSHIRRVAGSLFVEISRKDSIISDSIHL